MTDLSTKGKLNVMYEFWRQAMNFDVIFPKLEIFIGYCHSATSKMANNVRDKIISAFDRSQARRQWAYLVRNRMYSVLVAS